MPESVISGTVVGGRYRLVRELARGGMAAVWEADDRVLSRRVAVKILDPSFSVDDAVRARFRHEAVAAAGLSHPGIVATYDTGDDHGMAYIVMELVEGRTLRQILDQDGPLPVASAVDIATQIADALTRAHDQGLVHRDVKPGNVLVLPDGRVKVADFGIAKAAGSADLTRAGAVMGTARYLAPEQLGGQPADSRADVYALGLVLYEMLAGRTPFDGDNEMATAMARLSAEPIALRALRPDVPTLLERAVHRALARDPNDRFPSAAALHDAIGPFHTADGTPSEGFTAVVVRSQRRWWLGAAVAAVIAAVGVIGYLATGDSGDRAATTSHHDPAPLAIRSVRDFDPLGNDGREHPEAVALTTDHDPATAWSTERYATRDFGGTKQGLGLVLDLGRSESVGSVTIDSPDTGWSTALYVSTRDGATLPDWQPARATGRDLGQHAVLDVISRPKGRYVLVWITRLPASGRLQISEVGVGG